MAKVKELTKTEVPENGTIEKPTAEEELESIKLQYQDALEKQQQYANVAQRCLGAIEILERLIANGDASEKVSNN